MNILIHIATTPFMMNVQVMAAVTDASARGASSCGPMVRIVASRAIGLGSIPSSCLVFFWAWPCVYLSVFCYRLVPAPAIESTKATQAATSNRNLRLWSNGQDDRPPRDRSGFNSWQLHPFCFVALPTQKPKATSVVYGDAVS